MEKFTEDNFHRIMTKLGIQSSWLLRPIYVFKKDDDRIKLIDGVSVIGDGANEGSIFLYGARDAFELYNTIKEVESMAYQLNSHISGQFTQNSRARLICPNPDCHNIYAYFYEDWFYCPKCGTKLISGRDSKENENL